jgi:hypothetical protein
MLRRLGLSTRGLSALCAARANLNSNAQVRSAAAASPPQDEDWMNFDDDDFWFLDEMYEGRLESPEFLPESERKLLERESLPGNDGRKE